MYDLSKSPQCTSCGYARTIRVRRKGLLQAFVWTRLGYFPWECTGCRKVFLDKNRGKANRRRRVDTDVSAMHMTM